MPVQSYGPVSGDLGPNQIKWLRANIRPFNEAWKSVKAADANAARVKSRLFEGDDDIRNN